MQSQTLINLGLLVFVIVLSVFMFSTEDEDKTPKIVNISDINADTIDNIIIDRNDGKTISFSKINGDWSLIEPLTAPAHPNRIESILNLLSTQSTNQLKIDKLDLLQLGLDPAKAVIKFNDHIFEFGATNPLDDTRYVRHGDTVHTVNDQLLHQITSNEIFFINPKVIINSDNIVSINTNSYRLFKNEETWKVELNNNEIETTANVILNGWQQLEAQQVSPKKQMNVLESIEITFNDDSKLLLDVVTKEPELILVNNDLGLEYHVNQYMADIIFPKHKTEQ